MKIDLPNEKSINSEMGKILKEIRKKTGITQTQLSKKMKTSQSNLARIENGQIVRIDTLFKYIKGCGKKISLEIR